MRTTTRVWKVPAAFAVALVLLAVAPQAALAVTCPQLISGLEKDCAAGKSKACYQRGLIHADCMPVDLMSGILGGKDANEVTPWMSKGCSAGSDDACGTLGMLAGAYAEGKGVAKDVKKARDLYKLACDKGDKSSCEAGKNLGGGAAAGTGAPQATAAPAAAPATDSVSAQVAPTDPREDRCAKGEAMTCLALGDEYFDPQSATKAAKALPFYVRACDAGASKGCFMAGFIYNQGLGIQKDPVKARPLFFKACADSTAMACAYAGQYWQYGLGGPVDKQEAKKAYQAACDGGFKDACGLSAKVN